MCGIENSQTPIGDKSHHRLNPLLLYHVRQRTRQITIREQVDTANILFVC